VYCHVIVPEIGGGATVLDDVFNDDEDGSEGNEKGQVQLGVWPSNRCPETGGAKGIRTP
jgi:hypothetical protein